MLEAKEFFTPTSQRDWRNWLKKNHQTKQSVWLVCHKLNSGKPVIPWSNLVDEALCFGWIDSIRRPIDNHKFIQFFSRRKPKSNWSKINKEKVKCLIADGLMTKAGHDSIELAKKNGSWTLLDNIEELKIPSDLSAAFKKNTGSRKYFNSLSKSMKKQLLYWVTSAKRPPTREQRINEIATLAAQQKKPKQFSVTR